MKLAVIGGGASGIIASIEAKKTDRNIDVTVFESLPKACKKILVTGNGRCNFTNRNLSLHHFYGDRHFLEKIFLTPYSNSEVFFASLGVFSYCEDGRIYPRSQQSSTIRDALINEALNLNVNIITNTKITEISEKINKFEINNQLFDAVIIAGGGKSSPVHGSDGSTYPLLKKFGHKLITPYPALCGLITSEKFIHLLKGVRTQGKASLYINEKLAGEESGEIQFTDKAVSGIPVMNTSQYVQNSKNAYLTLDLCEEFTGDELKKYLTVIKEASPYLSTESCLAGIVNMKLGYVIMRLAGIPENTPVSELTLKNIINIVKNLKCFKIRIDTTKDFKSAQITCGGISTDDFSPETLMSNKKSGVFACGEVLNLHGDCGGYNLHLAWTTGRIAGASAVKYIKTLKG